MTDCSVDGCTGRAVTRGWCNRHYIRWQRRGSVEDRPDAMARYLDKVDSSPDGCWPWLGPLDKDGYGKFCDESGVNRRATRWGYQHLVGEIPEGLLVCHTCDHSWCHRPEHWFLGTPGENMRDRDTKGRHARADTHGMARLTWAIVNAIRLDREQGLSSPSLASKYGVSRSQILRIVNNQSWRV